MKRLFTLLLIPLLISLIPIAPAGAQAAAGAKDAPKVRAVMFCGITASPAVDCSSEANSAVGCDPRAANATTT